MEKKSELPKFSILTAMTMLRKAWDSIPNKTFTNCFKKAGISTEAMERALNDEDDPSADLEVEENVVNDLEEDLATMKGKFRVDYKMTAEELVDIEFQISITGTLSDAEIIAEISGNSADSSDDEPEDEENEATEILTKQSCTDLMNAIGILEDYSLFSNFGTDMMIALKNVNRAIDLDSLLKKSSQISMTISKEFKNCNVTIIWKYSSILKLSSLLLTVKMSLFPFLKTQFLVSLISNFPL